METILVLAASPVDTEPLRLGAEIAAVEAAIRSSRFAGALRVRSLTAPNRESVRRALLEHRPVLVHFAGHGTPEGLVFETEDGHPEVVAGDVLRDLFGHFTPSLRCVVLNACYSEVQARAISRTVDFVVGMPPTLDDPAALAYVRAFYDAIGAGEGVAEAVQLYRLDRRWAGTPERAALLEREGADPAPLVRSEVGSKGEETRGPRRLRGGSRLGLWFGMLGCFAALLAWLWPPGAGAPPGGPPPSPELYALRVQILSPDGEPVADGAVRASVGNEPHRLPDGWWQVEVAEAKVPLDRRITVWAMHESWTTGEGTFVLDGDPNPTLQVRLRTPRERILGTVTDADGRGVPDARVSVRSHSGPAVTTDADGRFEIAVEAAKDQRVRLHVEHADFPPKDTYCYSGTGACYVNLVR
ncbi:MAG: carboxypeptidase regulatory-like domain-containing protein [Acidobacteriota bacterium]